VVFLLGIIACGGGDDVLRSTDSVPPEVSVLRPAEGTVVTSPRPTFVVRVADVDSGIFCSTIEARIEGQDFSTVFLNGCDAERGEVRATGQIVLGDGGKTFVFKISDHAGNEATVTRSFTVNTAGGGPSPGN
jgi:hypothetical protein